MASASDTLKNASSDANEQIRELRRQVDSLMRDRVSPYLAETASRAQDYGRQAQEVASDQAEALSGQIRERPFVSILIAAVTGYLLGRISR